MDGTELPLYLPPNPSKIDDWVTEQMMYELMHEPPIMLDIPDLVDVNDQWIAEREQAQMVLLDEAFPERFEQAPPCARVRHYTYWSYIEGIRAEELSRNNWIAENSVLQAEALSALAFTLLKRPVQPTDTIWKTILTTQHHDVYCFCAPELRAKSIGWLQEAIRQAQWLSTDAISAVAAQVDTTAQPGMPLVVFNTVPHVQQGVLNLEVPVRNPQLVNELGEVVKAHVNPGVGDSSTVTFLADAPRIGLSHLLAA